MPLIFNQYCTSRLCLMFERKLYHLDRSSAIWRDTTDSFPPCGQSSSVTWWVKICILYECKSLFLGCSVWLAGEYSSMLVSRICFFRLPIYLEVTFADVRGCSGRSKPQRNPKYWTSPSVWDTGSRESPAIPRCSLMSAKLHDLHVTLATASFVKQRTLHIKNARSNHEHALHECNL